MIAFRMDPVPGSWVSLQEEEIWTPEMWGYGATEKDHLRTQPEATI